MSYPLAAVQIRRRNVSIAIFHGTRLDHAESKSLSSDYEQACRSLFDFVRRAVSRFEVQTIVLEENRSASPERAKRLQDDLVEIIRSDGVPITFVMASTILSTCSLPPLRTRYQARVMALRVWPSLNERTIGPLAADAALLGLFVQVERLLSVIPN